MPIKKVSKKVTVKKVVKKVAKKATKKTTIAKTKNEKKDLIITDDQRSFWVSNGQVLNSLVSLRDALITMEKDVYKYHAGGEQNDFALWIEIVLSEGECARDIKKAKTPASAKAVVDRYISKYKN